MTLTKSFLSALGLMGLMGLVPSVQAQTWQDCAAEGGTCRVKGAARVRFGAQGQYAYAPMRDAVSCNVKTFGDPLPGMPKRCEVLVRGAGLPSAGVLPGWQACAPEGGDCTVQGRAEVRFGAAGRYAIRTVSDRVACTVASFGGDPYPNRVKQCDVRLAATAATGTLMPQGFPPPFDGSWSVCSEEGEVCNVTGPVWVRFGAGNRFTYRDTDAPLPCTREAFGDPAPGQVKACHVSR